MWLMTPLVDSRFSVAHSTKEVSRGLPGTITVTPQAGESILEIVRRLNHQVRDQEVTILNLLVFGDIRTHAATVDALRQVFGQVDYPMTWVEGASCVGAPIAGIQAFAIAGHVERVVLAGRVVGSVFTGGRARHCFIGGLAPKNNLPSRAQQTAATLEELQAVLALAGFDLADTIRTWFFLTDLLAWYDVFNQVRTKVYSGVKFRTGSSPASTGVSALNPAGSALALAVWALRPLEPGAGAEEVASPLQCPAPAYGSSFSRAMEISSPAGRQLLISGTASIAPGGKTLWQDDVRKQVELTMAVVQAILHSRGFTLADLTRATAYFKYRKDVGVFSAWCREHGLNSVPIVAAQCAVCRDDLLFELEADAMKLEKSLFQGV
jgi:enamine deaminase RidA (YjgF/YER057c/UK114 family)